MKAMITVIAAFLSFPGAVAAQPAETSDEEMSQGIPTTQHQEEAVREAKSDHFRKLDEDGDGAISRQEAQVLSALSDNWSRLDRNGDGQLQPDEFVEFEQTAGSEEGAVKVGAGRETEEGMPATRHQEQAVEDDLVGQLDQNGDGRISRQEAEAEARIADNWDRLDQDDDGMLDSRELEELLHDTEDAE